MAQATSRFLSVLLAAALCLSAADRKPGPARGENQDVTLSAVLYTGKDEISDATGGDLGPGFVLVHVTVTPRTDKPVTLAREDFTLRSDKDGQKASAFAPSQVAGSGTLVVRSSGNGGGGGIMMGAGPMWGGMPRMGRPRPPVENGVGVGGGGDAEVQASAQSSKDGQAEDLLSSLKKKVFPETVSTTDPVQGQLYFLLEGKHKRKDLELTYKGSTGRVIMTFQ